MLWVVLILDKDQDHLDELCCVHWIRIYTEELWINRFGVKAAVIILKMLESDAQVNCSIPHHNNPKNLGSVR